MIFVAFVVTVTFAISIWIWALVIKILDECNGKSRWEDPGDPKWDGR